MSSFDEAGVWAMSEGDEAEDGRAACAAR